MKHFAPPVVLLLLLLFCVVTNRTEAAPSPSPIRIAYPEFPPFHWKNRQGKMQGLFFEILTEALEKRMHQPLLWTPYPWARCQEQLKAGRDDAIITVPTRSRLHYTKTHPHPFFNKQLHLFTYTGHPLKQRISQIESLSEIQSLQLSVITYAQNGWNHDHVANLGVKTLETAYLDSVWIMLARHRGDLVIEWPRAARGDLQRLGLENKIVDTEAEVAHMPFHLLIRKDSSHIHLLDRFEQTVQAMKTDGTQAKIIQSYE